MRVQIKSRLTLDHLTLCTILNPLTSECLMTLCGQTKTESFLKNSLWLVSLNKSAVV